MSFGVFRSVDTIVTVMRQECLSHRWVDSNQEENKDAKSISCCHNDMLCDFSRLTGKIAEEKLANFCFERQKDLALFFLSMLSLTSIFLSTFDNYWSQSSCPVNWDAKLTSHEVSRGYLGSHLTTFVYLFKQKEGDPWLCAQYKSRVSVDHRPFSLLFLLRLSSCSFLECMLCILSSSSIALTENTHRKRKKEVLEIKQKGYDDDNERGNWSTRPSDRWVVLSLWSNSGEKSL